MKVFLTASAEERARRRATSTAPTTTVVLAKQMCATSATHRRADSPLEPAADAMPVDTTGLTIDEVVEQIADAGRRGEGDRD